MTKQAQLTEIRADGMQKWERLDLPKQDHMRYVWLAPFQSVAGVEVGTCKALVFSKGSGGAIGGHWAGWRISA